MKNNLNYTVFAIIFVFMSLICLSQEVKKPYKPIGTSNNFFDNAETVKLSQPYLTIEGEVKNPGKVDFSAIPLSSVIVKETVLSGDTIKFIGAYRYDGYSLLNILNNYIPDKINANEFPPLVDLYVEIENNKNEKVVFSWGEIYYPANLNSAIIATSVMRVIPEKTGEIWPMPADNKIVCSHDLISERNITNPVKITVKSYKNDSIKIIKGKDPVYSPVMNIYSDNKKIKVIDSYPEKINQKSIHTIFYGKGRGLHSTMPFEGIALSDCFVKLKPVSAKSIKNGLWIIVSDDGYRSVFTYSEICNRNDMAEAIINFNGENKNGGAFRLLVGFDYFSDRAVKSIRDVFYME